MSLLIFFKPLFLGGAHTPLVENDNILGYGQDVPPSADFTIDSLFKTLFIWMVLHSNRFKAHKKHDSVAMTLNVV